VDYLKVVDRLLDEASAAQADDLQMAGGVG
jgi:hypothetical protein